MSSISTRVTRANSSIVNGPRMLSSYTPTNAARTWKSFRRHNDLAAHPKVGMPGNRADEGEASSPIGCERACDSAASVCAKVKPEASYGERMKHVTVILELDVNGLAQMQVDSAGIE